MTTRCPSCGKTFDQPASGRPGRPLIFCNDACLNTFTNLNATRGRKLLPLAQVWRTNKRGPSPVRQYAFREMCKLLDRYAAQDRLTGRRADLVVARAFARQESAADLEPVRASGE